MDKQQERWELSLLLTLSLVLGMMARMDVTTFSAIPKSAGTVVATG
jgi:hypothetical protein